MFRGSPNGLLRFRSHPARSEVHRSGITKLKSASQFCCNHGSIVSTHDVSSIILPSSLRTPAAIVRPRRTGSGAVGRRGIQTSTGRARIALDDLCARGGHRQVICYGLRNENLGSENQNGSHPAQPSERAARCGVRGRVPLTGIRLGTPGNLRLSASRSTLRHEPNPTAES
jgi:hypothetical protein